MRSNTNKRQIMPIIKYKVRKQKSRLYSPHGINHANITTSFSCPYWDLE